MSFEDIDDPALLVPRVLDVHGTLLRLGFQMCSIRSDVFYRQFVPLLRPVDPPIISTARKRQISHVELVVCSQGTTTRIYAAYGYPERYKKKLKLIEHFVKLLAEVTSSHIDMASRDDRLREFEKNIKGLIECLTTKVIDCTCERDSETGLVKATMLEYEALVTAVQQTLCVGFAHKKDEWWTDDNEPATEGYQLFGIKSGRVRGQNQNLSRLPSFDRRRDIRRSVRRPV